MRSVLITLFFLLYFFTVQSQAQAVRSADLIGEAKSYDGKFVVYRGELIGDMMARKDFVWINLNDGFSAIGVWLANKLTKDIVYSGSYKAIGDVLEVEGTFNRSCSEHGGDLDIHAQVLRKIKSGEKIPEKVDVRKLNLAAILLGGVCLVLILSRLKRR